MSDATPDPTAAAIASATDTAREVLRTEGQALLTMADALPEGFATVIDLIAGIPGRVIVSGIGKSGHIARKIAATLASTGTPALFVHPAEASHGDLGMVTAQDATILISNSGETAELRDILAHTRRFGVPTLAITSAPASTLAKTADHVLLLPKLPEACGIGMVPTTSTTLTLALGDAIAVALLRRRNFRAEDFSVFHPGGKLGAQMARVEALMHRDVPTVAADTPMSEALLTMTSGGFGIAAVTEDGLLRGIVTDGDLRRNMAGLLDRNAGAVATRDPVTVPPDLLAAQALAIMNDRKINVLIVVDQNRPVGVIHVHDLLRAGVA